MLAISLALRWAIVRWRQRHSQLVIYTDCARSIQRLTDILGSASQDRYWSTRDVRHDAPFEANEGQDPFDWDHTHPYFHRGDVDISVSNLRMAMYLHEEMNMEVDIIWIPSHSGIEGNERADGVARFARVEAQRNDSYWARVPYWRRFCVEEPPSSEEMDWSQEVQLERLRRLPWQIFDSVVTPEEWHTLVDWQRLSMGDWRANSSQSS